MVFRIVYITVGLRFVLVENIEEKSRNLKLCEILLFAKHVLQVGNG